MVKKIVDRVEWTPEDLQRSRRYILGSFPEYRTQLINTIGVQPGLRVVDVGCGTGAYSRILAEASEPDGYIIGLDIEKQLLATARDRTRIEGPANVLDFLRGHAFRLPLADNCVDIAFCHTVLWTLNDPIGALKEMYRVVKREGTIAAVEPDTDLFIYYDPEDQRYMELAVKEHKARVEGLRKLYGYNPRIGRELPELFRKAGLKLIRAYGRFFADLTSDLRAHSLEQELAFYRWQLDALTRRDAVTRRKLQQQKRVRLTGSLTEKEFEEFRKKTVNRLRSILKDPKLLSRDMSVTTWGGLIVTGKKP